jgi:hypothetical protein
LHLPEQQSASEEQRLPAGEQTGQEQSPSSQSTRVSQSSSETFVQDDSEAGGAPQSAAQEQALSPSLQTPSPQPRHGS